MRSILVVQPKYPNSSPVLASSLLFTFLMVNPIEVAIDLGRCDELRSAAVTACQAYNKTKQAGCQTAMRDLYDCLWRNQYIKDPYRLERAPNVPDKQADE